MNPLLDELRRRNDIKRTSAPVITPLPRGYVTRAALSNGTKPGFKQQSSVEEIERVSSATPPNDDIYDIPTSRPNQLFPAPPTWTANGHNSPTTTTHNQPQQFYNHDDQLGADEIYDHPPPRKTPLPSPRVEQKPLPCMEIYDSPPVKPTQQPNMEIYDLPPSKTTPQPDDDIYDMPPPPKSAQPPDMEIYDSPPVKGLPQPNMEIYDMPPQKNSQQQSGMEIYDSPPVKGNLQQRLSGMEIYDAPPTRSSENGLYIPATSFVRDDVDDTYEVPPQRRLPTDMASLRSMQQNRLVEQVRKMKIFNGPNSFPIQKFLLKTFYSRFSSVSRKGGFDRIGENSARLFETPYWETLICILVFVKPSDSSLRNKKQLIVNLQPSFFFTGTRRFRDLRHTDKKQQQFHRRRYL